MKANHGTPSSPHITRGAFELVGDDNDKYLLIPILLAIMTSAFLTQIITLVVTVFTFALFALPGFIMCTSRATNRTRALVYGLPLGYTLTSLLVMAVVGVHGWDMRVIAVAYFLGVGVLLVFRFRRGASSAIFPVSGDGEQTIRLPLLATLAMGMTVLALYVPLSQAGKLTAHGYAFTGLFGHDFILRAADSVAVANSIPSDNYFFFGEKTYNYYILWYVLPATVYNLLGKRMALTGVESVLILLNVPIFGALIYYAVARLVRRITNAHVAPLRLGCIFLVLFVFSYSYHWLFFCVTQFANIAMFPALGDLSARMGPTSTSWYKDFLFQPHCVLALMQFLLVMQLALAPELRLRGILLGTLLASILLTDIVVALVVGCTFGLWYISEGHMRGRVAELCVIGGAAVMVVALAFFLRIFAITEYSNKIVVAPYILAIIGLPALLPLWLGPLPVFWLLALRERSWARAAPAEWRMLLILALVSLLFILFITEVVEGNVFLRKSLMVLRLPMFVLSAAYLYSFSLRRMHKFAALILAAAVPTLATDLYATSQTSDARHTMYVTAADMAAADWLRTHTRPDAVVQSLIEYRDGGRFEYSLTICFGERKAALGLWQMAYQRYLNKDAITKRVQEIESMFSTSNAEKRASLLHELHIEYILVGTHERVRYPGVDARFEADPRHLEEAYAAGGVKIYRVRT